MLLTTLATAALGGYTIKTALAIARDQDVQDALGRLRTGIAQAAHVVQGTVGHAKARIDERRQISSFARQNGLVVSRVFESCTEDEKNTLLTILRKYSGE